MARDWAGGAIGMTLEFARRLLPPTVAPPIPRGPARGLRWPLGAGHGLHALGVYEPAESRAFVGLTRPGDVVYDIGAHAGYYTALAGRLVGPAGRVVAFEPLPRNLAWLGRTIAANRLGNVRVIAAAVSDRTGKASFAVGAGDPDQSGSYMGRLTAGGDIPVETLRLDEFVREGSEPPPALLKIDVEGAEVRVLAGARETIAACRPIIVLATHTPELRAEAERVLRDADYAIRELSHDGPLAGVLASPR